MLVIAGAGTGKTTVLTRRIAHLIREGHARPDQVFAVTYTKNAAQEMRERVRDELRGTDLSGLRIATFHEYCNDLLRQRGKQFGVLDDQDLWIYLRKRIRELNLNYFVRAARVSKFLEDLLGFIRCCHDELVGPEKYDEYVQRLERGELPVPRVSKSKDAGNQSADEVIGHCREIAGVFATVERMLREDNLGTFGHMITHAYRLLPQDSESRARTRFILVDEFQDVNFAQVKVLQKLAAEEGNVFAVGDPDQAIYRFRGASSAAFALFRHHFPRAKVVALEKNRRSTTPILRCAFALISKNPEVFSGSSGSKFPYRRSPLVSAREEGCRESGRGLPSDPVTAVILNAMQVEGSDLVAALRQRRSQKRCKWKDFAILYRTHSHRDQLATELAEQGIPFSIENMDVMDTPEARDLFACLGAIVSSTDSASLFRVAALPQFAIDPENLRSRIRVIPRAAKNVSLASVLAQVEGGGSVLKTLEQARDAINRTQAKSRDALDVIIRQFALNSESPVLKAILEFVENWEKKAITRTGELAELLEYLELFREARGGIGLAAADEDAVHLMTAHAAKGLEFNHVFIIRAHSPSFPSTFKEPLVEFPSELRHADSIAQEDNKVLNEQEERRLFYVAMTRARDSLTIYAKQGTGKKDSTPPGFLRDLLKDSSLRGWLVHGRSRGFQTDMFVETGPTVVPSRIREWLSLPAASNLHARLSATAVETYATCPLQFKLERDWRIPGEVPAAMQYGATMHRVLRAYYDSVSAQRPIEGDALLEMFLADLTEAGIQDRYQHDLYERQGIEQLKALLVSHVGKPTPEVLHTEEPFEVKIGDVIVVGRIDRMDRAGDGNVVIIDYKTGKPQSQEDADESLQLSIYALAARQKWGYRTDQLAFYNLEGNSAVMTRRSEIQLQEAKLKVQDTAQRVAAGEFEPNPGFHCSFCHYRNLCPATEKSLYSITAVRKS
jgi:superfamily I DNA/RNA helicase/RecB family exonuclease